MSAKVSRTTISLTRGDSLIIQISVNQEGKPYEIKPGDKIRFAMKKDLQDSEPLIMKQIDPQSLQLTIEPEDTKKLEFGKYMDGSLSEEDYAPVKAQRQAWRDRINELEALIINPTITQEDMVKAEEAALAKRE